MRAELWRAESKNVLVHVRDCEFWCEDKGPRRIAARRRSTRCCSRTVAPCGAALAPWRWELWRQGRRLSMKNVPCPISLPDVLVPAPAERPTGLPAYGPSNISSMQMNRRWQPTGPQWFSPVTNESTQSWQGHIWGSQFPERCDRARFLLFEDDLAAQGFGFSLNFYRYALMMAMSENRVLLEVPVDPNWHPLGSGNTSKFLWNATHRYSRTGRHSPARRPRWCGVPPFTLGCFFEPWSHCPVPDESLHVAPHMHTRWAFVIGRWPKWEKVVRVKLSWIYCSWFLWEGKSSVAEHAATAFMLRPRAWVREQSAACTNGQAGLRTRKYVSLHIRDSAEKRQELRLHGHSMPSIASYRSLVSALVAVLDGLVVHTSSDAALRNLTALLRGTALTVAHTAHRRNDHDEWGGWLASQAPTDQTLQGAIGIINAELASNAAVLLTPTFSSWSIMLRTLLGRKRDDAAPPPTAWGGQGQHASRERDADAVSFCCGCSPREQRGRIQTGNVMALISSSLSAPFRQRLHHRLITANITGCRVVSL